MGIIVDFPHQTRTEPVHKYDEPAGVIDFRAERFKRNLPKPEPKKEVLALPAPKGGPRCKS